MSNSVNPVSTQNYATLAMRGIYGAIPGGAVRPANTAIIDAVAAITPARENIAWNRTAPAQAQIPAIAERTVSQSGAVAAIQPRAPDALTHAELAKDVYNDIAAPPAGWRVATSGDMATIGVRPADLVSSASAFRARVYVTGNGADTQYVVAFRGSTSDKSDWINNFKQSAGIGTDHYRKALNLGRLIANSGADNVTLTGHSLGGGLASAASIASARNAYTFNASGLSDSTIDAAGDIARGAGQTNAPDIRAYYVSGEVLSALQDGGDRVAGALLGRTVGGILGGPLGGIFGGAAGSRIDAPEAYGTRIEMSAVRPEGKHWWNNNPVDKHGMDWVLSSLNNQ